MATKLIEYKIQDSKIKKRLNEAGFFTGLAKGIKKGIAQQLGIELPGNYSDFLENNGFKEANIPGWNTTLCYQTSTRNHDIFLIGNKDNNGKLYFLVDDIVIPTALIKYVGLNNVPNNIDSILDNLCKTLKDPQITAENVNEALLYEEDTTIGDFDDDGLRTQSNNAEQSEDVPKFEGVDITVVKDFNNDAWNKLAPQLQDININPFIYPFDDLKITRDVRIGFDVNKVNDSMFKNTNVTAVNQFIDVISANAVYVSAYSTEDINKVVGNTSKGYNRGQSCISYINKCLNGRAMSIKKAGQYKTTSSQSEYRDKLEVKLRKDLDNNTTDMSKFDNAYNKVKQIAGKRLNNIAYDNIVNAVAKAMANQSNTEIENSLGVR